MKSEYIEQFVGRVCTILTRSLNRDFKQENPNTYPEQVFHYFMGMVLGVDEHGIMIEQVMTQEHLRSYFFFHSIVGIAQEQVLDPNVAEHAREINEIKTVNEEMRKQATEQSKQPKQPTKGPVVVGEVGPQGQFIDTQAMSSLSKDMKNKFGG